MKPQCNLPRDGGCCQPKSVCRRQSTQATLARSEFIVSVVAAWCSCSPLSPYQRVINQVPRGSAIDAPGLNPKATPDTVRVWVSQEILFDMLRVLE